jgi:hypothetical protein
MKKALVTSIVGFALSVASSYGQGYVNMQNYDLIGTTPVYSGITYGDGPNAGKFVGANSGIEVDLLYSLTGTPGSFQLVAGSRTQFFTGSNDGGTPAGDGAGSFFGPVVTIPGYTSGNAFFIVEAYNGTAYNSPTTTFEGQSAVFSMPIQHSSLKSPPDLLNLGGPSGTNVQGLQPFTVHSVPPQGIIIGDLTNSYVVYGSNTTLSVTAIGPSQLSFQWYFLPANHAGQAGAYAEITNGHCNAAVVTNGGFGYGNVPNINFVGGGGFGIAGYSTVSNAVVSGITLTMAGSGYSSPPAVVIGAPNGFFYGQTNSTLNITNASQDDVGNYFVVVSDSTSSVTSSVVSLTVLFPPTIVQSPVGFADNFGSSNALSVVVSGTPNFSYQWMLNGTNIIGATGSNYIITNLTLDMAGSYSVEVTNLYGNATSSSAQVEVFPTLVSPFAGAVDIWGQDAVFDVGAIGSGSLFYQWYFNGQQIAGATNSSYELSSIQFTNAGLYDVVVSSQYGSVTNTTYQVVVNPANVSIGLVASLTIQGTVGNNYNVQSTTNLADPNSWATVTNITLTSPIQIWDDNSSDVHNPSNPQKYYRVLPGQ